MARGLGTWVSNSGDKRGAGGPGGDTIVLVVAVVNADGNQTTRNA